MNEWKKYDKITINDLNFIRDMKEIPDKNSELALRKIYVKLCDILIKRDTTKMK